MQHGSRRAAIAVMLACACGQARSPADAPRSRVERYGDGVFSTDAWDFFLALSPDGTRAMICHADDAFERYQLLELRRAPDGRWSAPTTPRFANGWSTADPHIAPDGKTVYFISNRAAPEDPDPAAARTTYDVFSATLGADGEWSDAQRLAPPINGAAIDKWSPSVASSGALYFGAALPGTGGGSDLWVARPVDGHYAAPENLGPAINTGADEVEPWIAPDESYLIFSAIRRAGSRGGYDLYLSRHLADGWTRAVPLGGGVNTEASEWNHSVSPDGRWLYFARSAPHRRGDIYRVPMADIGPR